MMKSLIAAAMTALLCAPEAAAQSIVQKSDWQTKSFESYLPPAAQRVPWLDLDVRTKLPKQDLPIGWQAKAVTPFVLPHIPIEAQVSSNTVPDVRRM
jgi:hypothetical protein